ncbi:MAG TPA: DUF1570 domain-containing protein [Planctomycetota bacterium]|nr:DUF1570 domain-containing protein [Planctomycetota bacterium]
MGITSERLRKRAANGRTPDAAKAPRKKAKPAAKKAKPAPAKKPSRTLILVGGASTALLATGVAVAIALWNRPEVEKETPKPLAVAPAHAEPTAAAPDRTDHARTLVAEAEALERSGHEDEAVNGLDLALDYEKAFAARKLLQDARGAIVGRFKAKVDEASALAARDQCEKARAALALLRGRCPDSLVPDLVARQDEVDALIKRKKTAEPPKHEDAPPREEPPVPTPTAPVAHDRPAPDDREQRAQARLAVTKALADLDVALARRSLMDDLDKKRATAVERLLDAAALGFRSLVGQRVELALRTGSRLGGKLTGVRDGKLELETGTGARTLVPVSRLALDMVLERSRDLERSDPATFYFAKGLLLAATGDKAGALEALTKASELEEACTLANLVAAGDTTVVGTREKPAGEPLPWVAKTPKKKTWMDDTEGGVPWDQAYVYETAHYKIKTNVKPEYAKRWGRILEALAEKYISVFQFEGSDFRYKKNELDLYRNQQEFMAHESQDGGTGGFYEPWSKRLVTFQGPWEGVDDATTLSIVAHEATHQFENLVLRQMEHAPTFMIEGLATFFEGTVVREDEVICGRISVLRVDELKRAIKSGSYVRLKDLIRTPHASYSAFHYAHGWGLVHWMMFGPEAKKAQKLLQAYWDLCCSRPATAEDFESLVRQLGTGWDMAKLEQSWKDWILGLDPANDPAIKLYEKRTGKKFPAEDVELSGKK